MRGRWLKVAEVAHVCPKPGGGLFGFQPKPLGSIWQCDECGQIWRIDYDNNWAGSGWEWVAVTSESKAQSSEAEPNSADASHKAGKG